MSALYSVTSGRTAGAAAASIKNAIALATGANVGCRIVQIDISFDGIIAGAKPVLVELVKPTGVSSGGSAYTPLKANSDAFSRGASQTTARINDTVDGSSPVIQQAYMISPLSGMVLQFPLGREIIMNASEFWELRVTWAVSETVVNYLANVWFEE